MVNGEGKLEVTSTPNQDNPLMTQCVERTGTPILGMDVWEHAYYLNYQNRRKAYIQAFMSVVNWEAVTARLEARFRKCADRPRQGASLGSRSFTRV